MTARKGTQFRAHVAMIGILRCVHVPPASSRALGGGVRISVRGTVEGVAIRSTLMPRGGGAHRLVLPPTVWRTLGLKRGDAVRVRLEPDDKAADPVELPHDFAEALDRRPAAKATFHTKRPAAQREIVRWLTTPKSAATRERRLEVSLDLLEGGLTRKP